MCTIKCHPSKYWTSWRWNSSWLNRTAAVWKMRLCTDCVIKRTGGTSLTLQQFSYITKQCVDGSAGAAMNKNPLSPHPRTARPVYNFNLPILLDYYWVFFKIWKLYFLIHAENMCLANLTLSYKSIRQLYLDVIPNKIIHIISIIIFPVFMSPCMQSWTFLNEV